MSCPQRIEQLANLLAVRLGSAPLDEMGAALVLNLAAVVTAFPPTHRSQVRDEFVALLDARIDQLAQAGAETSH